MKRKTTRTLSFAAAAALAVGLWLPLTYADTSALGDAAGAVQVQHSQESAEKPAAQPTEIPTVQPTNTASASSTSPVVPAGAEPSAPAKESPVPTASAVPAATPTATLGEEMPAGSAQPSGGAAEPSAEPSGQPVQAPEGEPTEAPTEEPGNLSGTGPDTELVTSSNEEVLFSSKARSFSLPNNAAEGTAGSTAVAKIGETLYSTLQEAVDAAGENAQIVLLENIDGGILDAANDTIQTVVEVPAGKSLSLDLSGHTVSASLNTNSTNYAKKHVLINKGNLTIVDTMGGGAIANTNSASNACTRTVKNCEGATLTVQSGTITSAGAVAFLNLGVCTVSGTGTCITSTRVGEPGGWDNAYSAIENRVNGQLTIQGGSISSVSRAALFCDSNTAQIIVTGGSFSGNEAYSAVNGSMAVQTLTVSGGTWSSDPTPYVARDAYAQKQNDGTFIVRPTTGEQEKVITADMDFAAELNALSPDIRAKYTLQGDITLNATAILPRTAALTIPQGSSLTVASGAVLTLKGEIENNGRLTVDGYMTQPTKLTGTGSVERLPLSEGVYSISTPMELQWLSYLAAKKQMPAAIVLKGDLQMPQGAVFQTIGEAEDITFDGGGHTISNLQINDENGATGLFVWLNRSVVKDLALKDCNYGTNTGTVGGIVGQARNSTFENITVSGSIIASGVSYGLGGIAGSVYQDTGETTTFVNCASGMDLTGANAFNVGAMFGTASGCFGTIGIYNCEHSGAIAVKGSMGYVFGFGYLDKSATLEIIGFTNNGTINGGGGSISDAAGASNTFAYKIDFADGKQYTAVKTGSGWTVYGPVRIGDIYYPTIAAAMAAVKTGETIVVNPGTYAEQVKIEGIPENVTLEAAGQVTLTGGITGSNWSGLSIKGFAFKNCGIELMGWHASEERFFRNVTLQNNRFISETGKGWINVNINPERDTATGLNFLSNTFDATAMAEDQVKSLSAINLSLALNSGAAAENRVSGNQIKGTGRGIQIGVMPASHTLILENNTIENVSLRGVQLAGIQAGTVQVTGNTVKNCGTGLRFHESYSCTGALTFEKNRFVGCGEDLWNLSPTTVLDGSGNYYGGGLPRYNLSTEQGNPNQQVVCRNYYEDEALSVLLAVTQTENTVDPNAVKTPPAPAGAPEGTQITEQEKNQAVNNVIDAIKNNTQASVPAQGLGKAAGFIEDGKEVYLQIALNGVTLQATYTEGTGVVLAPAGLMFRVKPYVRTQGGSDDSLLENERLNGSRILFRLPVPDEIALGSQAKVEHLRPDGTVADVQWPFVQQQEGEKFLPVAATNFSDFVVVFNAYKPPENTGSAGDTGSAGESPAATPVPYNWYGVLAQLQVLGEKGALTLDVAREIAVPQYIWQQIFGKDVTVTFKRGQDSFSFNGMQLKKAGFDPDNGHNLTDLASYTTQKLGQKASAASGEAPAESPAGPAEPAPQPAPAPVVTPAPEPSPAPQAAPSASPVPTAAQGHSLGVWFWAAVGAAVLVLVLLAVLLAVRRRR